MYRNPTNIIHFVTLTLALSACEQGLAQVAEDEAEEVAETDETLGTGTETAESGMDTSTFIPPTDGETDGGPACDPFMQDCPDGEKCVPVASSGGTWDSNECVAVTGDGQPGDTCSWGGAALGTDDCDADSICWDVADVDGELLGVCTSLCGGSANDPICEPDTSCVIANEGSITVCIATCDPLLQDCGEGLGCFWAIDNFNCVFTTQELASGEPCGFINDCAPGNLCTDASALPSCAGSSCCSPYCDLVVPDCMAIGTECVSFFEEGLAPPGYEDIGICVLPG